MPGEPEGVDWARVYFLLANECGIRWPEVGRLEQFMVVMYYEQARYDRDLRQYETGQSFL